MSRISTRLRAFAITTLTVVVTLSALSAGSALATGAVAAGVAAGITMPTTTEPTTTTEPALAPEPTPEPTPTADSTPTGPIADSFATIATSGATVANPDPVTRILATPAAPTVVSAASVVVAFARSHLRAAYRHDASGPGAFDCSGLMWRVFQEAGLGTRVTSHSARAIYLAYRRRGLASRSNPQVGDLIVWGQGSHVGVYIGAGYAISALINGVRVHRVHAVFTPFTAYLHTHLAGLVKPAWELRLATHLGSLRHATRALVLRTLPSSSARSLGTIRIRTRFVILAQRVDAAGRRWYEVLTFSGRTGWLPATSTAR